jgi:Zn-finger nucleic acid-binding protein
VKEKRSGFMVNRSGPMACPVDGTALVMSERQNIEIDYCPTCRGVWLDRGELDKIIERSAPPETSQPAQAPQSAQAPYPPQQAPYPPQGSPWGGGHQHHGGYGHHPHKKRRKSFLEELFD